MHCWTFSFRMLCFPAVATSLHRSEKKRMVGVEPVDNVPRVLIFGFGTVKTLTLHCTAYHSVFETAIFVFSALKERSPTTTGANRMRTGSFVLCHSPFQTRFQRNFRGSTTSFSFWRENRRPGVKGISIYARGRAHFLIRQITSAPHCTLNMAFLFRQVVSIYLSFLVGCCLYICELHFLGII